MSEEEYIFEIAAKTNKGRIRDGNEDNFIVTQDARSAEWLIPTGTYPNPLSGSVLVVADGMGGMNAGEVASKIVVDSIKENFINASVDERNENKIKPFLFDVIVSAHNRILAQGKEIPETEGMGSTVAMAWVKNNTAHICWVGDSRCYLFSNGILKSLSKDHSYVQILVDKGKITQDEAFLHPESNIITQSLGDIDRVPEPGYISYNLKSNDIILLCSDGLNSMLTDVQIEKILTQNDDLSILVDELISGANKAGGHDNITVLIGKLVSEETEIIDDVKKKILKPSAKKFKISWLLLVIAVIIIITMERKKIYSTMVEKNKAPVEDTIKKKKGKDS